MGAQHSPLFTGSDTVQRLLFSSGRIFPLEECVVRSCFLKPTDPSWPFHFQVRQTSVHMEHKVEWMGCVVISIRMGAQRVCDPGCCFEDLPPEHRRIVGLAQADSRPTHLVT